MRESKRNYRPKIKYVKQKKGRNQPRKYRQGVCRWHMSKSLITCQRCRYPICPWCHVRCWICQTVINPHPVLGTLFQKSYWYSDGDDS